MLQWIQLGKQFLLDIICDNITPVTVLVAWIIFVNVYVYMNIWIIQFLIQTDEKCRPESNSFQPML